MEMTEERNQRKDACNHDGKRVNCIIIGCIFFFFYRCFCFYLKSKGRASKQGLGMSPDLVLLVSVFLVATKF